MYRFSLETFTSFAQGGNPLFVNREACRAPNGWVAVSMSGSMGSLYLLVGAFLSLEPRPLDQQNLGSQERKVEVLLLNPLIPEPIHSGYERNNAVY